MKKKFVAIVAGVLVFTLGLVGCSGTDTKDQLDAKALEQKAIQSIIEAKTIDANLEITLAGNLNGKSTQVNFSGQLQEDSKNADFPIILVNGKLEFSGLPMIAKAYVGNGVILTDLAGEVKKTEITKEMQEKISAINIVASPTDLASGTDIKRVVTASRENDQILVNVVLDKDNINAYLSNQLIQRVIHTGLLDQYSGMEFESMEVVYVFDKDKNLQEIRYNMTLAGEQQGDGVSLKATMKINSLNGELNIQTPTDQ